MAEHDPTDVLSDFFLLRDALSDLLWACGKGSYAEQKKAEMMARLVLEDTEKYNDD